LALFLRSSIFDPFLRLILLKLKNSALFKRLTIIVSRGFTPVLVVSLVLPYLLFPLMGQAWFFASADAQSNPDQVGVSTDNVQNLTLPTPSVAMNSNDLETVDNQDSVTIVDDDAIQPEIGSAGTLADMVNIPPTSLISSYTVTHGDTVAGVAARFGVSEGTIREANGLSSTAVLHVGEVLTILPITGITHIVQSGDTFQSLAKKYDADASDIADYNNLDMSDNLVVGSSIIIPNGEVTITKTVTNKKTGKTTKIVVTGTGLKSGSPVSASYYIQPIKTNGTTIVKTQGFHGAYNAIDIGAPKYTPIHAMADGVVITANGPTCPAEAPIDWDGGYGNMTVIKHGNGTETLYAHQTCLEVSVGESVTQGQVIGKVGHTGHVEGRNGGYHLHFEIRGAYPTPIIYPGPVI